MPNSDIEEVVLVHCNIANIKNNIENTQADNAKVLDVVMPMYNLIEYHGNYSKTSGNLWQYCRDELDDIDITESKSVKLKPRSLNKTNNAGTANLKIAFPLKHLSNLWRTLEIPLSKCEIILILT